jgi:hypothetical protein
MLGTVTNESRMANDEVTHLEQFMVIQVGTIIIHGLHFILICGNASVTCSDDSLD